jgi:SAM-dependent methyltransferase
MFSGSEDGYFRTGESAVSCIGLAMQGAGKETIESILDLPCGHGRCLRALHAVFPDARLTACDLDRDGVDFCAKTFGATPVYSVADPAEIELDETFDLIWCGSLFTHLDADRFVGFLEFFASHLDAGGILCFTTNGYDTYRRLGWLENGTAEQTQLAKLYFPAALERPVHDMLRDYEADGFAYSEYRDIAYFDVVESFGATLSSPAWVCERLRAAGLRLVSFVETGHDDTQDFIGCVPDASAAG